MTSSRMTDENDARDSQLLADGDIAALLALYEPVIRARCIAKLRGSLDAEDVAQNVRLRLLAEFERGKRYGGLPYRVIVHKVIDFTVLDYFEQRPLDVLPDGWDAVADDDPEGEVLTRYYVTELIGELDGRAREVCERRYLNGLDHEQIAAELGITRNNVDQALSRGHARLREVLHV
jgi:RNA polymerase sigma factor (sigma-70 family)